MKIPKPGTKVNYCDDKEVGTIIVASNSTLIKGANRGANRKLIALILFNPNRDGGAYIGINEIHERLDGNWYVCGVKPDFYMHVVQDYSDLKKRLS